MAEYPPYVNYYGGIPKVFDAIKRASVPPKFNQDFLETVLGLKSSSYRAMIPFLKRLGFLDQGNVPTDAYKQYRDDANSKTIMAQQVRSAYRDLYKAHEYAHKLKKEDIISKLTTLLGVDRDDPNLKAVASCFVELCKLADLESTPKIPSENTPTAKEEPKPPIITGTTRLGLSYTINLNLPPTTDVNVFNAIFKSLKEHLLNG